VNGNRRHLALDLPDLQNNRYCVTREDSRRHDRIDLEQSFDFRGRRARINHLCLNAADRDEDGQRRLVRFLCHAPGCARGLVSPSPVAKI